MCCSRIGHPHCRCKYAAAKFLGKVEQVIVCFWRLDRRRLVCVPVFIWLLLSNAHIYPPPESIQSIVRPESPWPVDLVNVIHPVDLGKSISFMSKSFLFKVMLSALVWGFNVNLTGSMACNWPRIVTSWPSLWRRYLRQIQRKAATVTPKHSGFW